MRLSGGQPWRTSSCGCARTGVCCGEFTPRTSTDSIRFGAEMWLDLGSVRLRTGLYFIVTHRMLVSRVFAATTRDTRNSNPILVSTFCLCAAASGHPGRQTGQRARRHESCVVRTVWKNSWPILVFGTGQCDHGQKQYGGHHVGIFLWYSTYKAISAHPSHALTPNTGTHEHPRHHRSGQQSTEHFHPHSMSELW